MTRIGLISDTHGFLDPKLQDVLAPCDEIWHAGDIGNEEVLQALEQMKPVRAVHGNIDDRALQHRLPEDAWFEIEGLLVWMTHIVGTPPRYNARIQKILKQKTPDILVAGHSHILKVMRDPVYPFWFLNPGAAGQQGFHLTKTLLRFELQNKKIEKLEVIELGKRGALHTEP